MNQKTIIVIGGLSAGPSAAAKARRVNENARILLFEKGNEISYATCGMPYALSGKIKTTEKLLVVKPELLEKRFNIEMHLNEEVVAVNPREKTIKTIQGTYQYDKLVMATGAKAVLPPIRNIEVAENWAFMRTMSDFRRVIDSSGFINASHVSIIGGGLIGIEVAENLKKAGKRVTIIEAGEQVLPQFSHFFANVGHHTLSSHNVDIRTSTIIESVELIGNNEIKSLITKPGSKIQTDFVIVSAGIRPNTALLQDYKPKMLKNGALIVNDKMETSIPDIYAAGDCASTFNSLTGEPDYLPLGTHSNKAGRTAGANAAGGEETYQGGYGTAIIQIFEQNLARTGLSKHQLKSKEIAFEKTLIYAPATPGYYPDSKNLVLEITYDRNNQKILAAEVAGEKGVDKRIDVLSTAIYAGLKIEDLANLDLAYAPPFSPAKDPVVVAGFVAGNQVKHQCSPLTAADLRLQLIEDHQVQVVDLRSNKEIQKEGKIDGSVNIEIDVLRERLNELDMNKPVILYCAKGMRGYLGALILKQNGFTNVKNLAGGYTAWKEAA